MGGQPEPPSVDEYDGEKQQEAGLTEVLLSSSSPEGILIFLSIFTPSLFCVFLSCVSRHKGSL